MSDERQARLDALVEAGIAEALDERGDLAPPWARHPEIPNGSIGWRMGAGEWWLMMWWAWLERQPPDREHRLAYLRRHPPAPRTWQSTALGVVDPSLGDDDLGEDDDVVDEVEPRRLALQRELEQAGLIADDAAILAWLARNDPPAPPWATGSSVDIAVRHGSRTLTFFVRWALRRRSEGTLAAWLDAAPAPPRAWRAFCDALASGQPPAKPARAPRRQLAILLAATGDPPPPWVRGELPAAIERRFQDRTTYAGAWAEWAMGSFDDAATWMGYLQRCPTAPTEWEQVVREELSWLFHEL